jgi:hypothetical protein
VSHRVSSTVVVVLVISVPLGLLLYWWRRPVRGVPRDAMSLRGKADAWGWGLYVWPTKAYRDTLIDEAADLPESDEDDSAP